MPFSSELSKKQLKNLKRRIVSWIWETTPQQVIKLAIFCGIKVPKHLIDKYNSEE